MAYSYSPKRAYQIVSSLSLILVNIIPIYGVFFLGWDVAKLLFMYWVESVPVGIFAWLRISMAAQTGKDGTSRSTCLGFFPVHFGMFMLGHLFFLLCFFRPSSLTLQEVFVILSSLSVSHGISFFTNYVAGGEFQVTTPFTEMFRPYTRIIVMHLTLILGAFAVPIFPGLQSFLVVLVFFKTVIDLYSHLNNHSRYNTSTAGPISAKWGRGSKLAVCRSSERSSELIRPQSSERQNDNL